jgi:hypothetical protein
MLKNLKETLTSKIDKEQLIQLIGMVRESCDLPTLTQVRALEDRVTQLETELAELRQRVGSGGAGQA